MKPKTANFPAKSQADARTAHWPWLGFLVELVRLIIGGLFHLAPIPTAQNTAPARKPLRVFSFWKVVLTAPRHCRRAVTQVLMLPNMVVEKRKLAHRLLQLRFAVDLNQSNCALKGAEEALDAAIHPRRVRSASLMFDAELAHRQRKIGRNQSAIVVGTQRFGLAEACNQLFQDGQNRFCASVHETQAQQTPTAVINHAQKRVGFTVNRDVRPIQGPGLIRLFRLGCLTQYFAQLRDFIAGLFAQCGDIAFADLYTAKSESGIEHRRHGAAARVAARDGKQAKYLRLHPAGFAVLAGAIVLSLSTQFAAAEVVRGGWFAWSVTQIVADANEKQDQSQHQNKKIEQGHGFLAVSLVKTEGIWLWARV